MYKFLAVTKGVPQESNIGPPSFTLSSSVGEASQCIHNPNNNDLNRVSNWASANGLTINKCLGKFLGYKILKYLLHSKLDASLLKFT